MDIGSAFREVRRIKEISKVLLKVGLGYYVKRLDLMHHLFLTPIKKEYNKPEDVAQKIRLAMEELGPTFVKLGQLLSLRSDLIPEEYATEFKKLQDNVEAEKFETIKSIVEGDLKKPVREIFFYFSYEPIASASIGQVHEARLLDKERIVVKIQRPNVWENMRVDINILYQLAELIQNRIEELKDYNLKEIVEEFERYTREEVDYLIEARNIDRFYRNFSNDEAVMIPKVYWDFTTKRVLTMSYIDGVPIDEVKDFKKLNSDNRQVALNLANAMLKQVTEFGFFHADPHPGNVFVLKDNKIAFLDFGIVGVLNEELRQHIANLFVAIVRRDIDKVVDEFLFLGITKEYNQNLREDLEFILDRVAGKSIEEVNIGFLFNEMIETANRYKMKLPANFFLLVKAIITAEGVGKDLDPKFNLSKVAGDYVESRMIKELAPMNKFKEFIKAAGYWKRSFEKLPEQTSQILEMLKRGELRVQFQHKDVKALEGEIERSSNRVSLGIIIGALIVGSALVLQVRQNKWVAVFGFIMAIVLSMMLVVSIARERRLIHNE